MYLHQIKGRHIPADYSRVVHMITNMLLIVNGTYMLPDFFCILFPSKIFVIFISEIPSAHISCLDRLSCLEFGENTVD